LGNANIAANTILKDSIMARNISLTMENLQKGTDGFNQNMEALKHNFLFRGYFKSLERKKIKEAKKTEFTD
jgi:phospholipid/cholesterol/gamma-HCH transport system substrate-binding protein